MTIRSLALSALLFLLLGAILTPPLLAQGPGPESEGSEPFPFSDRYPALTLVFSPERMEQLVESGVDIGNVRPLFPFRPLYPAGPFPLLATIYVDVAEARQLEWLGFTVRPIPNKSMEAFRRYGPGKSGPDAWPTYEEFVARMQALASAHPEIVRMVSIGQSVQGRDIWMLKITDNPDVEEDEPEFKYTSTMHGNEPVGTEMTIRLAELLANNYGSDPRLTGLVDEVEVWLCPIHNPDGYVAGSRYNAHGVDLNRDFPDRITDPHDDPAGREPETQAMMYFGYDHRFVMGANYHTGALVVNYPWDSVPWPPDYAPDDALYYEFSVGYAIRNPMIWGAPWPGPVIRGWEWYIIRGGMQDWAYHWRGEHHVTIEISEEQPPPYSQMDEYWDNNREAMLWWMERSLTGVRGRVYDAVTGAPLDATVDIVQIGKPVRTDPDVGDYHRLLLPGTYTLTCSAPGYPDQFWPIEVVSDTATVQDCAMSLPLFYAVQASNSAIMAVPGETVTHTFTITNVGTLADRYTLTLTLGNWPAVLLDSYVGPLQPQETGQGRVVVSIPELPALPLAATVAFSDVFTLHVTSVASPAVSVQATGVTTASAALGLALSADTPSLVGPAGQPVTYTLHLTNTGAYPDRYTLSILPGNLWPAQVFPTRTELLYPGDAASVRVRVDLPDGPGEAGDSALVRAASFWDGDLFAEETLHTFRLYGEVLVGDSTVLGAPGETVTHTFPITNATTLTDTYSISLTSGDWPVILLNTQVGPLSPGEVGQARAVVHIPHQPGLLTGTVTFSDVFTLQAASTLFPSLVRAEGPGTTYAVAGLSLTLAALPPEQTGLAGQVVTYRLLVTNTGTYTDTYTLSLGGNLWPTLITPTQVGPLAPEQGHEAWVRVAIPSGPGGETDLVVVRATSGRGSGLYAEQELLTRRGWGIFLPLVNRQRR